MKDSANKQYALFWHPHQKLWNWRLISAIKRLVPFKVVSAFFELSVICADSLFLVVYVIGVRAKSRGPLSTIYSKSRLSSDREIVYLDVGLHKRGEELSFVVNEMLPEFSDNFKAFGFEANPDSLKAVHVKFSDNKAVSVENLALVSGAVSADRIKLFKNGLSGKGDSIYRESSEFEYVPCMPLSTFIESRKLLDGNPVLILRMNIEGAEFDVLKDLVDSGLDGKVACFMGMWDDLSKIDIERDLEFRRFLENQNIRPVTFNGRDMSWRLRRWCISYHIRTCVYSAS